MTIIATEEEILNLFNAFVGHGDEYWTRNKIEKAMQNGKIQFWGNDVKVVFTDGRETIDG